MRWSGPLWSLAFVAPLVMASFAAGLMPGVGALVPSLTTVGQILVVALGVFALWVGLSSRVR